MSAKDPAKPVVLVLVDDQHAKSSMSLLVKRPEERLESFDTVDRRHDKIE